MLSDSFIHLLGRVIKRLEDLVRKISVDGKETLLEVVIQSLLNFAMAFFNILKKICYLITNEMSSFWWRDTVEQKRIY